MLKVLIVDDDPDVRKIISALVKRHPAFEVSEAGSIEDALKLCAANKFTLLFLDHNVGKGNGWFISDIITMNPKKYGSPVVVAMSGSVLPDEAVKYHGNFSQFLPKPFRASDIYDVMKKLEETTKEG